MRIAVAPDSFKESMTALEAAEAMERGIRRVMPEAEVLKVPMADGGEGTVSALVDATGGRIIETRVTDPLGNPVTASFGVLGDGRTAVVEMAAASGLPLTPPEGRNPMVTTTRGTGELILAALDRGARQIIIGIGGSATVAGGAGMAAALGVRLLDAEGRPVGPGGGELGRIDRINMSGLDSRLREVAVDVACDVDNPLCGEAGAAAVYGPQKGATPDMVPVLDRNLAHFADVLKRDACADVQDLPGAGAAGGLGAGLVAFLGARLRRGIDIVSETLDLTARFRGCDLVLTGEGRLDGQSVFGKVAVGVARAAKRHGAPVFVIAGSLGEGCEQILTRGVDGYFAIMPAPGTLSDALAHGAEYLEQATEQVFRAFAAGRAHSPQSGSQT